MLHGNWRDDVGYTRLESILGSALPSGAGVPISIVEASSPDDSSVYFPNANDSEFSSVEDPFGAAVAFVDGSGGQANGVSAHSNAQAERFFW